MSTITILARLELHGRTNAQFADDSAALLASYLTEAGAPGIDELMASYQADIDALDKYDDVYELDDIRQARNDVLTVIGEEYSILHYADPEAGMYFIELHK